MNLAKSNSEPEPKQTAAVYDGLMPRMWLYCEHSAVAIRKILAVNFTENSVLIEGENPPETRLYMQFGGHEYLYEPLAKKRIEEIVLDEHPELKLISFDPKVIQLTPPVVEPCKVIQHPSSFFVPVRIEKPASKRKPEPDPKQLFLFTDLNLTA